MASATPLAADKEDGAEHEEDREIAPIVIMLLTVLVGTTVSYSSGEDVEVDREDLYGAEDPGEEELREDLVGRPLAAYVPQDQYSKRSG